MTDAIFALIGVLIGIIGSGIVNFYLQKNQFFHEKEMYIFQNQSTENVKALLIEILNHESYTDRSFDNIRKKIGGYSDDKVRQLLHEIGAKKVSRKGTEDEWWYLASREQERIERKQTESFKPSPFS